MRKMNPATLGIICLLLSIESRSAHSERWNTLARSENRNLFLSALQSYFRRRGIAIDGATPLFNNLPTKPRNTHGYVPNEDGFEAAGIPSNDIEWETSF
ncbi:hypothetical protein XENTR_v10003525 [Xenopus tropicalis]|uniref:Uncharacterized protein n=1 Tax=Xenopus tropicalis TaxID=8364 RepID=A0A1B8Y5L3_XENTR|nr:hypothetical protein XENTR_v10003525 [Xenopus tropicalis]KAE8574668.1 hypothetical protein XENTR_v10003525 [Xenopus tropicalis]